MQAPKPVTKRALALHRERGAEDREVAVGLNNLGTVLSSMKDFAGALLLYRARAWLSTKKVVGPGPSAGGRLPE